MANVVNFAHITSTKNSLGLPIAMRKDCLLAVSSGGTEAKSRPGGAPGGPMTGGGAGIIIIGGPYRGGTPGGP